MTQPTPKPFDKAVSELAKLPGLGQKTAERLAFHLLGQGPARIKTLAESLESLSNNTNECIQCHHLCEGRLCSFCEDPKRDASKICVVELPQDLVRIEEVCDYNGLYHVLGGRYAPLEGIFPEDLNLDSLRQRVASGEVSELVLALNPNTEGEATCDLITRSMASYRRLSITRLATGMPRGSEIGFSGRSVLRDALAHRREVTP